MEKIEKLAHWRQEKGYVRREYDIYAEFLKTIYKNDPIYEAERFLIKAMLSAKKPKFVKKFMKMALKKAKNTVPLYSEYLEAIKHRLQSENPPLEPFIAVRKKLADVSLFSDELDGYIRDIDPNAVPERLKIDWYDIELLFSNEGDRKSFLDGRDSNKTDYQSLLQKHIHNFEGAEKRFLEKFKKCKFHLTKLMKYCKLTIETLVKLLEYLETNFQNSIFCKNLLDSYKSLNDFLWNLERYQQGNVSILDEIRSYDLKHPKFQGIFESIEFYKNNIKIDIQSAQEKVLKYYFEKFNIKESTFNVPFLPTFYDISCDYINYPEPTESNTSQFFSRLSFFKRK